ncbi:MAG: hypothetical protein ACJAXW_002115 [Candidatus Azotimanducaceae bacterium]|jgi:hypothetical protein
MRKKTGRLLPTFLIALGFLVLTTSVRADAISATDAGQQTMSKFMINLAKFVTWPEERFDGASAPYKYCLMGDDPFAGTLDSAVSDKQAKSRGFTIERLGLSDVESAKSCHVVFVNVQTADQATDVIDSLSGLPILTVGEVEKFAQYGGMVGFLGEGRKVALAINQKRLEGAGLKASSRLYRASNM